MNIIVSSRGVQGQERASRYVERRISSILKRFEDRIERVHIQLSHSGKPPHDYECSVTLHLFGEGVLHAKSNDNGFHKAATQASNKLKRMLTRQENVAVQSA